MNLFISKNIFNYDEFGGPNFSSFRIGVKLAY